MVCNLRLSPNERICSECHYIEARKAVYDAIYIIGARIKNVMLVTPTQKVHICACQKNVSHVERIELMASHFEQNNPTEVQCPI